MNLHLKIRYLDNKINSTFVVYSIFLIYLCKVKQNQGYNPYFYYKIRK